MFLVFTGRKGALLLWWTIGELIWRYAGQGNKRSIFKDVYGANTIYSLLLSRMGTNNVVWVLS